MASTQRGSDTHRASTGGHFELAIDGHPTTAYLKTVDGGYVRAGLMDEAIGPDNHRIKHTSVVSIEPFSIEFGLAGASDVLSWIQQSWRKEWSRRNGEVRHANFDLYQTFSHQFFDALITETTFPTLDGASKDAAYLKVKIQPERVVTSKSAGDQIAGNLGAKHKMWMCSGFRLNIDDLQGIEYTNKIESFTIKQGVKQLYTGAERLPQIEPTKIEFPAITGTIALGYADSILKWYDDAVVTGRADPSVQKSGSIEFLSPDRGSVLFRLNLYEVGIGHAQIPQSTANSDQIKRVKFELYVGRMDLDTVTMGFE
ncbi:MAG: phage tail protein [Kofleriaceae bacterium]